MPPISFLDLVPKRPRATVSIETEDGAAEYEIGGVPLSALAEISRRYPKFQQIFEDGGGLLSIPEAMPALIAAGFGHPGDAEYEQQAAKLPSAVAIALASEVVKLTFTLRPTLLVGAEAEPVPEAANGALPGTASPLRLSN